MAALTTLAPVSDRTIDALVAVSEPRSFAARAWLLRAGEPAEWCFLLESGLVPELYVGRDGEEHTRAFIEPGQLTGSLLDLLSARPAVTFIQALESTTTIAWRYRDFEALARRFPELNILARRNAERLSVKKTLREHEMLSLPAAARYDRFCADNPALDKRLSRRQLASYLGITPEHLSRLRRAAPARR